MNCNFDKSRVRCLKLALSALIFWCGGVVAQLETTSHQAIPDFASGWRLNTAGQYQLLSEHERADHIAQRPAFCQSPRPDGFTVPWTDANSTLHRLQFSNESGVLRWWSASLPPQMILPYGTRAANATAEVPEFISGQLALTISQQLPKSLQVVWPEPQLQRYSAVDLTDPINPRALWQWQAPMMGSVQTPVIGTFKTTSGIVNAVLMVSGNNAAQPAFWLLDAATGQVVTSQIYSRTKKTVELPFVLQDLTAAPAVLDRNADGYADRIYLVDSLGRLVQVDVDERLQFQSRIVADLSDAAAKFTVQLVASRAVLPDQNLFATTANAAALESGIVVKPEQVADTIGSVGQQADLVVLVSAQQHQSQLWVLTIQDLPAFTIQPHHLTRRDLAADDTDMVKATTPTILTGWYGALPATPVSVPQIFAGVLYLPVAGSANICAGARQATQLIARHIFQGSQVYPTTDLSAIPTPFGALGAVQRNTGELALQDLQSGALLLPQLRGIRPDCRFCTAPLHQNDYPKWQRMAIYQHESELY